MIRRITTVGVLALLATAVVACGDDDDDPVVPQVEAYVATINAASEVPTNSSTATGTARVEFTATGITYTVSVTGLRNLSAAHIHAPAPVGQNASVVFNFAPTPAPGQVTNGVIAAGSGTTTAVATISIDSLKALIRNGQAYVNVHTSDAALPGNNTPGDLPGGEIRGQLVRATN